jgi:hypothetical protein
MHDRTTTAAQFTHRGDDSICTRHAAITQHDPEVDAILPLD